MRDGSNSQQRRILALRNSRSKASITQRSPRNALPNTKKANIESMSNYNNGDYVFTPSSHMFGGKVNSRNNIFQTVVPKTSADVNKFVREAHRQEYMLTEVVKPGSRNYKAVHLQTEESEYNSEAPAKKQRRSRQDRTGSVYGIKKLKR